VPAFVVAQLLGGTLGVAAVLLLYPSAGTAVGDVVVPHSAEESR
jgi:hypothetical protein